MASNLEAKEYKAAQAKLKEAWNKLKLGDPLTDQELLLMWQQADRALDYFDVRGKEMYLASVETTLKKNQIEMYLNARGYDVYFDSGLGKMQVGEKREKGF